MKTMYYEKDVSCFSPNDVIQVNNSCATASTVARGDPSIGQGVLGFILPRVGELRLQYFGRTGEVAFNMRVSAPEYAAMARLASLLGQPSAAAAFVERGVAYWERVVSSPEPDDAWMASEVLLGLQAVLA